MVLNILLALSITLISIVAVLGLIILKAPSQARTIIYAWLFKRVITIEATLSKGYRFVARKYRADNQLVAKVDGRTNVKFMEHNPEPSLATPYHLEGSGVKVMLGFVPHALLVSSGTAAAIQVAGTKDKDKLPDEVKAWAKNVNIGEEKLLELGKPQGRPPKGEEGEVHEKWSGMDLAKISQFAPNFYSEADVENMIEQERWDARLDRKDRGNMKLALGIVVIAIGAIILLAFLTGAIK